MAPIRLRWSVSLSQDYVDAIRRVVGGLDERPILVEHSMGTPIAAAAEADPDAVAALVFVAGLLPRNGSSLLEAAGDFDPAYLAHCDLGRRPVDRFESHPRARVSSSIRTSRRVLSMM